MFWRQNSIKYTKVRRRFANLHQSSGIVVKPRPGGALWEFWLLSLRRSVHTACLLEISDVFNSPSWLYSFKIWFPQFFLPFILAHQAWFVQQDGHLCGKNRAETIKNSIICENQLKCKTFFMNNWWFFLSKPKTELNQADKIGPNQINTIIWTRNSRPSVIQSAIFSRK